VGILFDLMFLSLMVLLIFSSGIILYSSLFSSAETGFLLTMPARADFVFAYKYQGALAFSSWGFLLLGSPVLIAHGLVNGSPWYFYPLLILYFVGFVLLPGSIGALICLAIVNYVPRRRKQVVAATIVIGLGLLSFWIYSIWPRNVQQTDLPDFFQGLLAQLAYARGPLAPNHWMSRGLIAAARGDLGLAVYCLTLVWANGLFLYVITAWLAFHLYRRGYNRLTSGGYQKQQFDISWVDRGLDSLIGFLDPQTRLLIIKDFRTFRRDPAQWAQVLILMALVVLYFANMRRFYQEELGKQFQNPVSIINLIATTLLLCAYTGRFIYPMLSLEGKKFWILGLLPLSRSRLVLGKFAFSATWSLLISEFLILFSDMMLGLPIEVIAIHALTVFVVALGLSGLSVGFGAWMPNFRETDPSKIAVGFSGTMNLLACLVFLLIEVVFMAVPWHVRASYGETGFNWVVISGLALGILVGVLAVIVPLRIGTRALNRMEF
ncbi:MAG: hypothetical protein AB7K24_24580, partial [Gemmataceae bacterium]